MNKQVMASMVLYERMRIRGTERNLPPRGTEWFKTWANADRMGATLAVIHNIDQDEKDGAAGLAMVEDLRTKCDTPVDYYPRKNEGRDIAAMQRAFDIFLRSRADILYWSTDDALPMRRDFLKFFVEPFNTNPKLGLVCNYYVHAGYYPNMRAHARTVSFAISRPAATRVVFPPSLATKDLCYEFEYGAYNLLEQVTTEWVSPEGVVQQAAPFEFAVVCGDKMRPWYACNDVVWDCDEIRAGVWWDWRRRQDHWALYEEQFK